MGYTRKATDSYPLIKCVVCKQESRARKPTKIYCSNACRQAAAHKRHDDKVMARSTVAGGATPPKGGNP